MTTPANLSCPTPDSYAAIAKQMHETAVEAEERIFALEQTLRGAVNLPTMIQTTTVNQTGIGDSTDFVLGTTFTTNFLNFDVPAGTELFFDPEPFSVFPEGMYEVGFCATFVPSGVANLNSQRTFRINHLRPDPSMFTSTVDFSQFTMYESGTGNGVNISMTAYFRMRPLDSLLFTINHANIASTLTMELGAIFWMHRTSDANITVVV